MECRRLRSLLCGQATSDRGAGRSPGGGVFCPPRCVVRLVLHLLLGPGGKLLAPWTAPCWTSGASPLPEPQRSTAARAATRSAVVAAFSVACHGLPAGVHCHR